MKCFVGGLIFWSLVFILCDASVTLFEVSTIVEMINCKGTQDKSNEMRDKISQNSTARVG